MDRVGKRVRMKKVKETRFIPDEIITNILIRLPVKSLLRFELVCKRWRDMISSRDFVDLHHTTSSNPLIFVAPTRTSYCFDPLIGIDKWWDLSKSRSMLHKFPFFAAFISCISESTGIRTIFSHAGLIVVKGSWSKPNTVTILNPARPVDESVKIHFSREFRSRINTLCAVYYHPLLNEYCCLWSMYTSDGFSEYTLLILGSTLSLKRIVNPSAYRASRYNNAYPLFINNHLYWMLKSEQQEKEFGGRNDILEFDIVSEEFKIIPCPVPLNTECKIHQTHLLNIDGIVSFILVLSSKITIWRLEDRVHQLWEATEYTTSLEKYYQNVDTFGVIAVVNEKLAFKSEKRLFVCNLREGTVKNVSRRSWYNGNVLFLSHQMTLASLKICKSPIYIAKDGKACYFFDN